MWVSVPKKSDSGRRVRHGDRLRIASGLRQTRDAIPANN